MRESPTPSSMYSFSQRHGHSPSALPYQQNSLNEQTRIELWNFLSAFVWSRNTHATVIQSRTALQEELILEELWGHFFKWDMDNLPRGSLRAFSHAIHEIKQAFLQMEWWKVYDFLEFLALEVGCFSFPQHFPESINLVLSENNADHRFMGIKIAPFVSHEQMEAIQIAQGQGPGSVGEHLQQSLELLSDRQAPDYRNSIQESLSAVGSAVTILTGEKNGTLGNLLKKIPDLNPSLSGVFRQIYSYADGPVGIHPGLKDDSVEVTKDDAQFMLVACSALTSYLFSIPQPQPKEIT